LNLRSHAPALAIERGYGAPSNTTNGRLWSQRLSPRRIGAFSNTDQRRRRQEAGPKGYNRGLVNLRNVAAFQDKFADANVGLVCGPSNVNILDIDEPSLADDMLRRFGDTPLKVQTGGRGGFQFYYRAHPEIRPVDLRATEGLPVEVKAGGNIAIAPPSVNFKTSREYRFIEGTLDKQTLRRLPRLNVQSLLGVKSLRQHRAIGQGQRNDWLFGQCLKHAHHCDTFACAARRGPIPKAVAISQEARALSSLVE
jgi:hypothetical protein